MYKAYSYKWTCVIVVVVGSFCQPQKTNGARLKDYNFELPAAIRYAPGELLVRFAPRADGMQRRPAEKNQILISLGGGTIKHSYRIVQGLSLVKLPPRLTVRAALKPFNQAGAILYAEPNYEIRVISTVPNDPMFDDLWGMQKIRAPEAWDFKTSANDIIVAVIDSGVDYTHPDLSANIWINAGEDHEPFGVIGPEDWDGIDDDGNDYVDDICGYDFCKRGQVEDSDPMDENGHGTHVSGTIGAVGNNGVGVTGVCWNVRIMAVKCSDPNGVGYIADAIECIEYAQLMGAHIMNNSWAVYGFEPEGIRDAVCDVGEAGILFVAAAGNEGGNNDTLEWTPEGFKAPAWPARCNVSCDNVIAVLATNSSDIKPSFSNYGRTSVELGAPGVGILSCTIGDEYESWNGTSMATPHVSGACALIWSEKPELSLLEVKQIIMDSVDEIAALNGLCVTGGRLNLDKAMALATESCFPICHDDYAEWIYVGMPECWCYPRQCHGDADDDYQGKKKYWVSTNDLDILVAAWNKPLDDLVGNQICADFDHAAQGKKKYRVSTNDLDILIDNWNQANLPLPDCFDGGRAQQAKGGELDVERIFEWIAKVWLDPEVRKVIGKKRWLEFIESLKSELQ